MTVRVEPLTPEAVDAVTAIVRALPQWFDRKARHAVPIDVLHQRGFVARVGGDARTRGPAG